MATSEQFSFRDLKGPKADVLAKIEADEKTPMQAKVFLDWLISAQPCEGVTLGCHGHAAGEGFALHITVKKLY